MASGPFGGVTTGVKDLLCAALSAEELHWRRLHDARSVAGILAACEPLGRAECRAPGLPPFRR